MSSFFHGLYVDIVSDVNLWNKSDAGPAAALSKSRIPVECEQLNALPPQKPVKEPSEHSLPYSLATFADDIQRSWHPSPDLALDQAVHVEPIHRNEPRSSSQPSCPMPGDQPGAFNPLNTLDAPAYTKSSNKAGRFEKRKSFPVAHHSANLHPRSPSTVTEYSIENRRSARRPNTASQNEIQLILDPDPDELAFNGSRATKRAPPPSSKEKTFTFLDNPVSSSSPSLQQSCKPRSDGSRGLFSGRNEFKAVENMMRSAAPDAGPTPIAEGSPTSDELNTSHDRRSRYFLKPELSSVKKDRIPQPVDQVADPEKLSEESNKTNKRRKTSHSGNGLKPSCALDKLLDETAQSVEKHSANTEGTESSRPSNRGNIRHNFVRAQPYDSEMDELQAPAPPLVSKTDSYAKRPTWLDDKDAAKHEQALASQKTGPIDKSMSSADITPTAFTRSNQSRSKEDSRGSIEHERSYALSQYYTNSTYRSNEPSLMLVVNLQNDRWVVRSSETRLPVDKNDVEIAVLGDYNGKKALLYGKSWKGYNRTWHCFVFASALILNDFRLELGTFEIGVYVKHEDDNEIERLLERVRNAGGAKQLFPNAKQKLSSKSPKGSRSYQKGDMETKSSISSGQPVRTRSSTKDRPRISGIDEIEYEPCDQVDAPPPRRKTRLVRLDDDSSHATQSILNSPAQSRRGAIKYAESPDLGPPWSTSLVFPRQGNYKATVEFDDLERLDDDNFLNDNLVAFCLKYAQHYSPSNSDRVHTFNSFFYETLTKDPPKGQKINYDAVKRWTTKARLFEGGCDHIIVPINENFHWYLAIICNVCNIEKEKDVLTKDNENHLSKSGATEPLPHKTDTEHETKLHESGADSELAQDTHEMSLDDKPAKKHAKIEQKDDSDLDISPAKMTIVDVQSPPKKKKSGAGRKRREQGEPVILILDSLSAGHSGLTRNLKDYLKAEANDKIAADIVEPMASFEKAVPGQKNFSDCGLYLVGYIARFLEDPQGFIEKAAKRELGDDPAWEALKPRRMRHNIRSIIMHEYANQLKEASPKSSEKAKQVGPSGVLPPRPPGKSAYEQFTSSKSVSDNAPPKIRNEDVAAEKSIAHEIHQTSNAVDERKHGRSVHSYEITTVSRRASPQKSTSEDTATPKFTTPPTERDEAHFASRKSPVADSEDLGHATIAASGVSSNPRKRKRGINVPESEDEDCGRPPASRPRTEEFSDQWFNQLENAAYSEEVTAQAPSLDAVTAPTIQEEWYGFSDIESRQSQTEMGMMKGKSPKEQQFVVL